MLQKRRMDEVCRGIRSSGCVMGRDCTSKDEFQHKERAVSASSAEVDEINVRMTKKTYKGFRCKAEMVDSIMRH